jgi:hypothetical protein
MKAMFSAVLVLCALFCVVACSTPADKPRITAREVHYAYESYLGIPTDALPPPGMCRLWLSDRPPSAQAQPVPCDRLENVPRGAWVLHRVSEERVELEIYDRGLSGGLKKVLLYEVESGQVLDRTVY